MPQTLSAKRALRVSRRRAAVNALVRQKVKKALSLARKKPSLENLRIAEDLLDQAAKKGIIHKNKASRVKRRLYLLLTKSGKVGYTKEKHAQKPNKPPPARRIRKKAIR
ncbi:MAG: 30S ribosomal protein S20 [Patescibacteria group bacterium]